MSNELVSASGEDFVGTAHHDGSVINAVLEGTADYAALDAIGTLLTRVHAEAKRLGVSEVVIDLMQLEFMNSSCFKCFVSWITDIQDLTLAQQYKVTFRSNPQLHWQKRSLHSLRCFAIDLITVVES